MNRKAASRRIEQLRRDHRGSPKEILTDPDYPSHDPHNIPGVYFIVEYRGELNGADPERVKIGNSDDPRFRLAQFQTGNSAELHLEHVIYAPDRDQRHAIETDLHHRFRHLRAGGGREWFLWTDELSDFVSASCREQCWE